MTKNFIGEINDDEATGVYIEIPGDESEAEHSGSHSIELVESLDIGPDLDLDQRERLKDLVGIIRMG